MRSSARRDRCVWSCAQANTNSAAKSRSITASSAFSETASKPRSRGQRLAVERQRGARQRARAQRQHVHAPPRVAQPLAVAHQRPGVGGRQVAERDGLGRARVGEAGHHRVGARLALRGQRLAPARAAAARRRSMAPRIHRRSAVTACSLRLRPEVALAGQVAHDLAQPRLHEAVHVLGVEVEVRRVRLRARRAPRPGRSSRRAASAARKRAAALRARARRRARPRSPRPAAAGRTRTSG